MMQSLVDNFENSLSCNRAIAILLIKNPKRHADTRPCIRGILDEISPWFADMRKADSVGLG